MHEKGSTPMSTVPKEMSKSLYRSDPVGVVGRGIRAAAAVAVAVQVEVEIVVEVVVKVVVGLDGTMGFVRYGGVVRQAHR